MNLRCPALLRLAEGQSCANCGADDGTVVAAHSNWSEHGKGKSIKAHDIFHAHLCSDCHRFLDQASMGTDPTGRWTVTREDKKAMFRAAMDKTMLRLWLQGSIGVRK